MEHNYIRFTDVIKQKVSKYLGEVLYQHTQYSLDMDRKDVLFPKGMESYGRFLPTYNVANAVHLPLSSNVTNGKKHMRLLPNRPSLEYVQGANKVVLFLVNTSDRKQKFGKY